MHSAPRPDGGAACGAAGPLAAVAPSPATQLLVSVQLKAGETVCATPFGSKTVQNTHFTVVKLVKTCNQDSFCFDYPAFISVGNGTRQRPHAGPCVLAAARARRGGGAPPGGEPDPLGRGVAVASSRNARARVGRGRENLRRAPSTSIVSAV